MKRPLAKAAGAMSANSEQIYHIRASENKNLQESNILTIDVTSTASVHPAQKQIDKSSVTPRNHIQLSLVKNSLMPVTRRRMMTSRMNQFVKRRPRFFRQIRSRVLRGNCEDIKALRSKVSLQTARMSVWKTANKESEISKFQQYLFCMCSTRECCDKNPGRIKHYKTTRMINCYASIYLFYLSLYINIYIYTYRIAWCTWHSNLKLLPQPAPHCEWWPQPAPRCW